MTKTDASSPRLQVGALCWRRHEGGVRVLLVTSRETRRWIIPKGNRMKGLRDWEAAAAEAREEAGVHGRVEPKAIGRFHYDKRLSRGRIRPCVVDVYPLEVFIQQGGWEEGDQRDRRWMTTSEAALSVDEPELARLLNDFEPEGE